MQRFLIGIARFALSAWVGAAVLFVVVGVQEVRSPHISSTTRDVLVALRFPAFYWCGFVLVGTTLLALFGSAWTGQTRQRRDAYLASGLVVALLIMVVDYFWVYLPLLDMVSPPGKPRPASFVDYHSMSKWLNFAALFVCSIVAWILCGIEPAKQKPLI